MGFLPDTPNTPFNILLFWMHNEELRAGHYLADGSRHVMILSEF